MKTIIETNRTKYSKEIDEIYLFIAYQKQSKMSDGL